MPSPSDFRKSFALNKGTKLRNAQGSVLGEIVVSQVGHLVKRQNELYEFPSTLEIAVETDGKVTKRQLETALRSHTSADKTVYSAYGSPYLCTVHGMKVTAFDPKEHIAQAKFTGKASRRRDIPTLAKQKEEERAKKRKSGGSTEDDISQQEIQQYLGDYRIIKSRFGSSKCADCGNAIDPGVKIARKADFNGRGGWLHVKCAVEAEKQTQRRGKRRSKRRRQT